jgi:hypothetical protein
MLRIRPEQVNALTAAMRDQANVRLAEYARKRFPTVFQKTSDKELRAFVEKVRAQAKKYGITREDNVATILDFAVMYGEGFDEASWASEILASQVLHGPDKVAILRQRVRSSGADL